METSRARPVGFSDAGVYSPTWEIWVMKREVYEITDRGDTSGFGVMARESRTDAMPREKEGYREKTNEKHAQKEKEKEF